MLAGNITFNQTFRCIVTHSLKKHRRRRYSGIPPQTQRKDQSSTISLSLTGVFQRHTLPSMSPTTKNGILTILQIEVKHASRGLSAIAELLVNAEIRYCCDGVLYMVPT